MRHAWMAITLLILYSCAPASNPLHRRVGSDVVAEHSLAPSTQMDAIENLLSDGLYDDARQALHQAIDDGLKHPRAFFMLGNIAQHQERYEDARKWFDQAIHLAPSWPEPRLSLAEVYLTLERPAAAEQVFADLAQQFPRHPAGPHGQGWIALIRNKTREAAKQFEESLSRDADFAPALAGRARVARLDNNAQLEQTLLQRYRILRPLDPFAHFRLGQLEQAKGLLESARRNFKQAYELRPNRQTARALADLAIQQGDQEAARHWEERSR